MNERDYQSYLIKKLRQMFPECFILKNDTDYLQGIPDLLILFEDKWAMLEVKAHRDSSLQPNQDYYIAYLSNMSFARFIYPEIEKEVLDDLQHAFQPDRPTRFSKR